MLAEEASIEIVQRWLMRRESDENETGSSSGSPGARAGRRSSLALTPEDEPLVDIAVSTNDLLYLTRLTNCTSQRKANF
ncbi:hypothetical protein KGM_214300 [Danaus plexippus plexippus]|uniref:Uncharacterized protein n=1 Tax=Danaus plexippus plexippus TaxID=278856 RepID=A0A212EGX7_DANPL|nr:hypothetical protein KGM_214300 [Danaus plexippus plexippus]